MQGYITTKQSTWIHQHIASYVRMCTPALADVFLLSSVLVVIHVIAAWIMNTKAFIFK